MNFKEMWEYQQGSLMLKSENNSLEWKRTIADYFWHAALNSSPEVQELRDEILTNRVVIKQVFAIVRDSYDPDYANPQTFEKLKEAAEMLRECVKHMEEKE